MPFLFLKEDLHVFLHNLAGRKQWQTAFLYRFYPKGHSVG